MGTVFPHVADSALRACGGVECHHCGTATRPVYRYPGRIVEPARSADPALATADPDIEEACAHCILGGNLRRRACLEAEFIAGRFSLDRTAIRRSFDQLPDVALFLQGFDWPICCDDWCEFVGSPDDMDRLIALQASARYWEKGPRNAASRNFGDCGPPESMSEISEFRCLRCASRFYVDQFT